MCGILCAIGDFERERFVMALELLAHRGPDGEGIWREERDALIMGHRRLSIVDTTDSGRQPMQDGALVITFNGEIYNYVELRKILESKGHSFKSTSDTEVILKSFLQWGEKCVNMFNGMWAFAIWDKDEKKLFLARDRFGVKPLFYAFTPNGFVLASEMKAIAKLMHKIEMSSDFEWCLNNIYEYEATEKSLINGIKRFPAGHTAYFFHNESKIKISRYWNTLDSIDPDNSSYSHQVEKFREIFLDACKIRMRSDVKIGTSLSGGLDSSSVAAAMNYWGSSAGLTSAFPDWQNAFVATFKDTYLDETEYAEEVVKSLNLKGHFFEVDGAGGLGELGEYLWFFEELFLTSPVPMTTIYKAIKNEGVSVSLDGHGADELLAGYGHSIFNAVKDDPFSFRLIKEIIDTFKKMRGVNKRDFEILVDGFAGRKNLLKFYLLRLLRIKPEDELIRELGYFNAALYKEFHLYILPTLLRNYDRYSMAAGVEVRMPFLDYRLVTHSFSLPWQSKVSGGYTKSILRDAMKPYLPLKVIERKSKVGFGTPFTEWFLDKWRSFTLDIVHSESFNNSSFIQPKEVRTEVLRFFGKKKHSPQDGDEVWKKLMPYLWEQHFFKKLG